MKKELSEKGKNWKGEKLTEDNLSSRVIVKWRSKYYETGNRYHHLTELYDSKGKFIRVASMNHIYLVKPIK